MGLARLESTSVTIARGLASLAVALLVATVPVAAQQTGTLAGIVSTSAGPIANVQVSVVGTELGALSTAAGRFLILNVPAGQHTVVTTLIGYGEEQQDVTVAAGETTTVNITIQSRAVQLEGVVVTGTAIAAQRREIGNSIELLTSEDIETANVSSVEDLMRGRALGVTVMGQSGTAGTGGVVTIRGQITAELNSYPLIYVDGIRMNSTGALGTAGGGFGDAEANERSGSPSILQSINPEDIERMEIIKGAAATTLYGSEASAGVIQIFTKQGVPGETRWTFTMEQGLATPPRLVDKDIDPSGLHMNDCTINGPIPIDNTPEPDPGCPTSGSWLRTAHQQQYGLSVRGGGEGFSYFASGNVGKQVGVINVPEGKDDQASRDVNLRFNMTFNPTEKLSIRLNNFYTRREIRFYADGENSDGLMWNVSRLTEGPTPGDDDSVVFDMDIFENIDHYNVGANVNYTPLDNFSHRLNVGMDLSTDDQVTGRPFNWWRGGTLADGDRELDLISNKVISVDYAGSLNYALSDAISGTSSWGGQFTDNERWGSETNCRDFIGPGSNTLGECETRDFNDEKREGRNNGGVLFQQMFGFNNRIFVTGGFRVDSHSTFGEGLDFKTQFLVYPKLQATYTMSDEDFFPDIFDTFRLRAAYGRSGQPPPADASKSYYDIRLGGEGWLGYEIDNIANPDIGPEQTDEVEGGIDMSLMSGRLAISTTGFFRKTFDGQIDEDPAVSLGISEAIRTNVGEWNTWGAESAVDVNLVDTDAVRLNLNVRHQWQDSKFINFGQDESGDYTFGEDTEAIEGFPWPAIWDPMLLNPDSPGTLLGGTPECAALATELGRTGPAPAAGGACLIYSDTDQFFGRVLPPHQLSIGTTINFLERFTLDLFGVGQFGHILEDEQGQRLASDGLWPACTETDQQYEAWRSGTQAPDGLAGLMIADIAHCSRRFANDQDWKAKADFFRFQSATLSWQVPESLLPSSLESLTLQAQARNLFLFTNFPGIDPDAIENPLNGGRNNRTQTRISGFTMPLPKTFTFSLRANF